MSYSPPNKPYKSRLFNFLNRQYINFNSQVNLRLRQLGYLVSVGVKTLIYPLHLLVENSKKLRNKLASSDHNKSEHSLLNPDVSGATLALPNCDQLIVDVNNIMTAHQTIKELNPSQYNGLACNLLNHKLVFVNQSNEINDILSSQQQQELSAIIREIRGDYWQQNRVKKLQEDNSNKNQSIAILAFKQLQKIKQHLNQLQLANLVEKKESENIADYQQHNHQQINTRKKPPKILLFFDTSFAKLENISLFKTSNHSEENQLDNPIFQANLNEQLQEEKQTEINNDNNKFSLFVLIQSAIEYFFGSHKKAINLPQNNNLSKSTDLLAKKNQEKLPLKSEKIALVNQQVKGLIEQSRSKTKEIMPIIKNTTEKLVNQGLNQIATVQENLLNRPSNEDNPFKIQALIWAAIDYFFQPNNEQNNLSSQQNKSANLPFMTYEELMVIDNEITDPWLSWADLFGEDFSGQELVPTSTNALSETTTITTTINTQIQEENEENSSRKKKAITESGVLRTIALTDQQVKIISAKEKILEQEKIEEIEAKVIEIKYEKHLLEVILEKLDQIILWLEELLIKIWQGLISLIKGKQQSK